MPDAKSPSGPPSPPALAHLHLWQIQWVRDLMIIGAVFGVLYLGYQIRIVTVPMLLALTLAYLFEPLVRWLRKRRLCSRRVAAISIIGVTFIVLLVPLTLGAGFAVVQGARAASELAGNISKVQKSAATPADESLQEAVPAGAWMRIRDFLAERPARKEQVAAGLTPTPAPGAVPHGSVIAQLAGRDEMRELGQRAIDWLSEHAGELSQSLGRRVANNGADAARAAFATATTIGTVVLQAVLTALFFYFFSTSWGQVLDFSESFIPKAQRGRAMDILGKMDRAIAGFVRGRVTICLIEMGVITLLYFLAGVPMPLLLGPIVGMLFIVPYMNTLGIPIAMLLLWLQGVQGPIFAPHLFSGSGGLWWILLAPPAIHLIGHALDDYFLNPMIQGKHTDLAIPMIVFSSIAGGALAGVYGLLLAIPVAACVRILMKEVFWPRIQAWVRGEAKDLLPIGKEQRTMMNGWSTDLAQILHYGVYVLLGIVCLGAIVRALWAPMDIHRAPCCGGCGHGVRDILQGVCPECGGQYAKVGITTPSMAVRLRGSLPIALLAWTTLIGLGASLSHGWLEQRAWAAYSSSSVSFTPGVGGKQSERYTTDLTPVSMGSFSGFGRPESKTPLEYRISLDLSYVTDGDKVESGTCVMKLRKNGEPETLPLTIDLADGSFTIKDDQGKEIAKGGKDSKVEDAVVEQWFDHAGLDTKDKGIRRSIKDAAKIARYARADPGAIEASLNNSFSTGDDGALHGNGSSRSSGPGAFAASAALVGPPGIGTLEMSLWIGMSGALYAVGCVVIIWRNRRVLRG